MIFNRSEKKLFYDNMVKMLANKKQHVNKSTTEASIEAMKVFNTYLELDLEMLPKGGGDTIQNTIIHALHGKVDGYFRTYIGSWEARNNNSLC